MNSWQSILQKNKNSPLETCQIVIWPDWEKAYYYQMQAIHSISCYVSGAQWSCDVPGSLFYIGQTPLPQKFLF